MSLYTNRIQAPVKTRTADWFPEQGELFQDASGNLYMGDNVTASTALSPINGTGSVAAATCGLPYIYDSAAPADYGNAGAIRMDSTTAASVTTITLGQLDLNNEDQESYLDLFTSGLMKIYHGSGLCLVFKVTRMVNKLSTDNYFEFTVEHVSGTMPTHLDTVRMDAVMDAPGVRRWIGYISQTSTDAPTLTALINTLEESITAIYEDEGEYNILKTPTFDETKTIATVAEHPLGASDAIQSSAVVNGGTIGISVCTTPSGDGVDGQLNNVPFSITIYP